MKPIYQNTLLILISIFLFILFGEILARIFIAPPPQSEEGWHIPSQKSILNYELNPGKEGIFQDYYAYINDYGRRDYHNSANFSNPVIAFVGDSITFGQGVGQNYTISQQFEDIYNSKSDEKITALNFGIGGYNLEQEVELINEKILDYNPESIFIYPIRRNPCKNIYCTATSIRRRLAYTITEIYSKL